MSQVKPTNEIKSFNDSYVDPYTGLSCALLCHDSSWVHAQGRFNTMVFNDLTIASYESMQLSGGSRYTGDVGAARKTPSESIYRFLYSQMIENFA